MLTRRQNGTLSVRQPLALILTILLNEIINGAQQRRLTASVGEAKVVLDVSNRQLVRVFSVVPADLCEHDTTLIATRDDVTLGTQLLQLGSLFAGLAAGSGPMTVSAVPIPLRYSAKLKGFSKRELVSAIRVVTEAATLRPQAAVPSKIILKPAQAAFSADPVPVLPAVALDVALPAIIAPESPATAPVDDDAVDTRFFDLFAAKSEAAVIVDLDGNILQTASNWEMLETLCVSIVGDMVKWVSATARLMSRRQCRMQANRSVERLLRMMRVDRNAVTILVLQAAMTGRVFSAVSALGA